LCYVQISEIGTAMTLLSAAEDFTQKTLSAVPTLLGKLKYVSGLRRNDGQYEHWGLIRVYGMQAVQQALEDMHRELVLTVLRMPLRELVADAAQSADYEETSVGDYVARLSADAHLLPDSIGGGSVRHFNTVLQALSNLIRSCKDANRLVS
jgi:hypothetical protein